RVTAGNVTKYAHDTFLQQQDPELGWIRNVMRVAGTECDAAQRADAEGLHFAVSEWIGDFHSGQLGYYRRKSALRSKEHEATQRLGRIGLWSSAVCLVV